ncbi:MAG: aldehyde dehydrogenase family protein, partial [Pirellulales bacterium]|nr:aldehyde dehydrogenase family protein [Pirellulales bacterium]
MANRWSSRPCRLRCKIVASAAAHIAQAGPKLTQLCANEQRTDPVETITAELLPLCAALGRLGRRGAKVLRTRRYGWLGRPAWLWGVRSEIRRDPRGDVLILGVWNYPLLLAGIQAAQALAAGNRVLLKPAPGCESVSAELVACFHQAGVPLEQLVQLESSTQAAVDAIDKGVDLIVLTGAAATGRKVLAQAAQTLTPTIMELSGCDAVVVTPSADLQRTADAIVFGLNFNSGATCIGPRRILIESGQADALIEALGRRLQSLSPVVVHPAARSSVAKAITDAIEAGAVDCFNRFDADEFHRQGRLAPLILDQVQPDQPIAQADLFAPLCSVIRLEQISDAATIVNGCRYRLAAAVFGAPGPARVIADRLRVGSVTINDLIVPTADPR